MEKPYILHMLTPAANLSPFDVNMAIDAGYQIAMPYTSIGLDDVTALVQDAIFSRGPKGVKRTGLFIGGRDMEMADDMLKAARKAMVPPFTASVFADPSGSSTTAAALVAMVDKQAGGLAGKQVVIFGGTGPVGMCSGILAARSGADVILISHREVEMAQSIADVCQQRFQVTVSAASGATPEARRDLLKNADIVISTAKAGIQVLSAAELKQAEKMTVAADVNAVPPMGLEGIDVMKADTVLDTPLKATGIGALAVGNLKYRTQNVLLKDMIQTDTPLFLDFQSAFDRAKGLLASDT